MTRRRDHLSPGDGRSASRRAGNHGEAALALTKRMQFGPLLELWIVREALSKEIMDMARDGSLVDRRGRRAVPLLSDRLRAQDSLQLNNATTEQRDDAP
jgi:hypothetical protein